MIPSHRMLDAAEAKLRFTRRQLQLMVNHQTKFDSDVARLRKLLETTRRELANYLLAEVGDDDLDALQERLHYPGLMPIKRKFEARLETSAKAAEVLATKDDIKNFDFHLSQTRDELQTIEEPAATLQATTEWWESSKWFAVLESKGYFKADYEPASLMDRFRDWRAVSYLMRDLEASDRDVEFDSATELQAQFVAHRDEADPIAQLMQDLSDREQALLAGKARYDKLLAAPQTLFDAMYEALGTAVLNHVEACPESHLMELAAGDHHLVTFLKKVFGLRHQASYLEQLRISRVDGQMQSLQAQINKLNRKIAKYKRKPYAQFPERDLVSMQTLKEEKWEKRHLKITKIEQRVASFRKYKKGSFRNDYLWWDVMSGGARADDLYEVKVFRKNNPEWDYRTYDDALEEAASAAAMDTAADALAVAAEADDWDYDGS